MVAKAKWDVKRVLWSSAVPYLINPRKILSAIWEKITKAI
jgi:hypothetical protein